MKLIDGDALKAEIQQDCDMYKGSEYLPDKARRDELYNVIARIVNAPTVDAVPVVRCKDCKYAHMTYDGECKYCQLDIDDDFTDKRYRPGNFYCAFGERKEDDGTR